MKYPSILTILLFIGLSFHSNANQFYQCKDSNGKNIFQDTPCENETVKVQTITSDPYVNEVQKNKDNCKATNKEELREIKSDIDAYYTKRIKGCKMNFKSTSYQIKNCFQEQKDIRKKKMDEYYKPRLNECS
jgi:hypothetical protein